MAEANLEKASKVVHKSSGDQVVDANLQIEEGPEAGLERIMKENRALHEEYRKYCKDIDLQFKNSIKTIQGLQEEHNMLLKIFTEGIHADSFESIRRKRLKKELLALLGKEKCITKKISDLAGVLKKDQILVTKKEEELKVHRKELIKIKELEMGMDKQRKALKDIETRKYIKATQLNSIIWKNKAMRNQIHDILVSRAKYGESYKKILDKIEDLKEKKRTILLKSQQHLEEKENMISMLTAMTSGVKKEGDDYEQKVETMKQMMRNDSKATSYMVTKLNKKQDLKKRESENKNEELKKLLSIEDANFKIQNNLLQTILDAVDDEDGNSIVHLYNQTEGDKMALFNYIADLNGELVNLNRMELSARKDLDNQKLEMKKLDENYNSEISGKKKIYDKLKAEYEQGEMEQSSINKSLEDIKKFIMCVFKKLNCDKKSIESQLGLDLTVHPGNMPVFLKEIEKELALIDSHYLKGEELDEEEEIRDEIMNQYNEQAGIRVSPVGFQNIKVPGHILPNPNKDSLSGGTIKSLIPDINQTGDKVTFINVDEIKKLANETIKKKLEGTGIQEETINEINDEEEENDENEEEKKKQEESK